jgi:hypothetical protein
MGFCNSPDIFPEKMSEFMFDLEFDKAYLNPILVISKDSFESHLKHLEKAFISLASVGLILGLILTPQRSFLL